MDKYLANHHFIFTPENPKFGTIKPNPSTETVVKWLNEQGENAEIVNGKYDGAHEKSILVSNPKNVDGLKAMGKDFGQESVLHSQDGNHELHYINGPNEGRVVKGQGSKFSKEMPEDNFTTIHTHEGPIHFSHNLDFNPKPQETYFDDPWDQAKHNREEQEDLNNDIYPDHQSYKNLNDNQETYFADPWDQAKHNREEQEDVFYKSELRKDDNNFKPDKITKESEFGGVDRPLSVTNLYRHYKHTPHHPVSLGLKYLIHLIENKSLYNNQAASIIADANFLKLQQEGKASEKNGHININDLHSFYNNHKNLIPKLINHKKQVENAIFTFNKNRIKYINGIPHVALTRGLNAANPGPDHALASYGDVEDTGFGDYMFKRYVPLKNIWYSYDFGPQSATSKNFGNENEFLVSPHKIIEAPEDETVSHLIPRSYHRAEITAQDINKHNDLVGAVERQILALKPNLHVDHQAKLVNDSDKDVRRNLASNPNLHPDHQAKLMNDSDEYVRQILASNPNLHVDHQAKLVNDSDKYVRQILASNPNLHPDHQAKLVGDSDEYVRRKLASNPNLHPDHQAKLVGDSAKYVRQRLASNPNLHPDHQAKLVGDSDEDVRRGLASNPNLHVDHQAKLVNDSDKYVRQILASNPNLHPDVKKILNKNLNKSEKTNRMAELKSFLEAPPEIEILDIPEHLQYMWASHHNGNKS